MKKIYLLLLSLFGSVFCFAEIASTIPNNIKKTTQTYLTRDDSLDLKMDIYQMKSISDKPQPCMLFVFGGGFVGGRRDNSLYNPYFTALAQHGITVVSIDYRLGLKGVEKISYINTKPTENAIQIAVEDLFEATKYVLKQANDLRIDTSLIMISGSSAGAITVLQADYIKRNNLFGSDILPAEFQYDGVLAFAGAILSHEGVPDYAIAPAPTLFFHGENDKIVVYNKTQLFNKGLFGSNSLAKKFRKSNYPYCFYSIADMAHSVATAPMISNLNQILDFIDTYIYQKKTWQMDIQLKDTSLEPEKSKRLKDIHPNYE